MAENRVRFRADIDDKVSSRLTKIRDNFDRVGKSKGFSTLTQGVGLGAGVKAFDLLGTAVGGMIEGIQDSVAAASDLNESVSKSNVIFGPASQGIERFGDSAAESLGLSKQAAIEAAATFGNFFVGIGKGQTEAADMSQRLVTLAGDLASFNNIDPTTALEKLRSGLTGEAEPLRQVGVFLTEAKVKAKAMELGLGDAHGELTEGEKVMARYQIILDETATAQGDFARTSDSLANQQRIVNAELENLRAEIGTQWQPTAVQLTRTQLDIIKTLTDWDNGIRELQLTMRSWFGDTGLATRKTMEAKESLDRWVQSASEARDGAVEAAHGTDVYTGSMGKAEEATEKFNKDTRTAKERSDDLRDSLVDTANSIIEGYYRPIEIHEEMAANKAELASARKILASKNSSAAERRDAHATLTAVMKDNDKLALELLSTGEMTTKETKKYFANLNARIKDSTGDAKQYLINLRKEALKINNLRLYLNFVARIRSEGVGATVHGGGLQHGGPAHPFHSYVVGEDGPETLVMGATPGYVIPNGGMAGAPTVIVNYNPQMSTASPNEVRTFTRAIIPELRRELVRQGYA